MKKAHMFSVLVAVVLLGTACSTPSQQINAPVANTNTSTFSNTNEGTNTNTAVTTDPNQPDLLIKHLGLNVGPYDSATKMAGDIKFIKSKLGGTDRPLSEFGYIIPGANTSTRMDKPNPQPTFSAPLGTKVHAIVDGEVVRIETLYSNDFSIMLASSRESEWIYELEHVIKPVVKVGDHVKAGDIIAEVSTHDSQHYPGIGLVEIGILRGGNPPQHVCPFQYLDPTVKVDLQQRIKNLQDAWETYRGNKSIYGTDQIIGCKSLEPIQG
ncbi:MAG: M23 family metallopeptidase [Patescibacteria group bacterium]|jgi:ABC-type Fe3+-hydroxamate transport system substrate-binding protein